MITSIEPNSTILKKYIDFFYVFSSEGDKEINYFAFPHVNTAISFFKGVKIERNNLQLNISGSEKFKDIFCTEILGKYTSPVFVKFQGKFHEIAIIFKPLGVNQFIKDDLINFAPNFSQPLHLEPWHSFPKKLFDVNSVLND